MQPYTGVQKPNAKPTENTKEDSHDQTDKMPKPEIESESFEPYKVLELSPNADAEEIKSNYRKLVFQYHPDRVQHLGKEFQELAHKRMLEIQRAYESLSANL